MKQRWEACGRQTKEDGEKGIQTVNSGGGYSAEYVKGVAGSRCGIL